MPRGQKQTVTKTDLKNKGVKNADKLAQSAKFQRTRLAQRTAKKGKR